MYDYNFNKMSQIQIFGNRKNHAKNIATKIVADPRFSFRGRKKEQSFELLSQPLILYSGGLKSIRKQFKKKIYLKYTT